MIVTQYPHLVESVAARRVLKDLKRDVEFLDPLLEEASAPVIVVDRIGFTTLYG